MPPTEREIQDLYLRYAHVIRYRARSILGSDEEAADAVQETFAKVLRGWDDFRHQASMLTWMYQISTNWCLNRLRAGRGHARSHEEHLAELGGEEGQDDAPGEGLDVEVVRELLAQLDEETQRIVIHLYFDELTREETARMLGISVPTLRKRHEQFLRRARRKLGLTLVPGGVALFVLLSLHLQELPCA